VLKKATTVIRLTLLIFAILVLLSSTAAAEITGFVALGDDGSLYEYRYDDLLDSFALKMLGLSNGLYEDFAARKSYALLNSSGRYIDYADVLDRYASALILNQTFDVINYTAGKEARPAEMPGSVKLVEITSGKLVFTAKPVSTSSTESNPVVIDAAKETPILGPTAVTLEQARQWATSRQAHQSFIDIAAIYWEYGAITGMRPEVLYAQSAVETDFGKFNDRVTPDYNNWAGIKTVEADGNQSEDHEVFATPEDGVRAHFNHMAAYVGLTPIGETHALYQVVATQSWTGTVRYVEELSGKWTPSADYHTYILVLLGQMNEGQQEDPPPPPVTEDNSGNADSNSGPTERHVAVDVDILRLRSGPGTTFEILDRLSLGTVLKVTEINGEWLKVITPAGKHGWVHGDYTRAVDMAASPITGKTIVIDPGHGGSDPGAIGFSGLKEKVVNISVAQQLVGLLNQAGANVVITRSGDQSVSHQQRMDLANSSNADLFVSIHANAFTNPESNGTESHYCAENDHSSASRFLAHQLQRELVSVLNLRNRGVKSSNFYVLKNTVMPAALVELAFMSNQAEEAILGNAQSQTDCADALFRGIEAYLLNYR
jgi:N-acetylmuramoyl-L-alanine amidase